ncbi:regulator of G-protein signaling 18-like [Protopterus annectens]|uniref:regulator of G-protein signaling 18-like n=1 Tax=Protopterus annectens TaxID=7888 RepID=UPI001CFC242C|nr:regulator of G-protein signaling 18-like [Protopterus annectens]
METVMFLFPQLNVFGPKEEPYYKIIKSGESEVVKRENNSRAKEKRNRLSLLLQKSEYNENDDSSNKAEKSPKSTRDSSCECLKWSESLQTLLFHKDGLHAFSNFLRMEFSDENIDFWLACEDYKKTKQSCKLPPKAKKIYEEFIQTDAPKEVNLDARTKEITANNMRNPCFTSFNLAQSAIYNLMEQDSYPRFLKSESYLDMFKYNQLVSNPHRRRSRSFNNCSEFKEARADFTFSL